MKKCNCRSGKTKSAQVDACYTTSLYDDQINNKDAEAFNYTQTHTWGRSKLPLRTPSYSNYDCEFLHFYDMSLVIELVTKTTQT